MKVVFDIDDTLWGLIAKICNDLHIDINLITDFHITNNDALTQKEKDAIIATFQNPETFKHIKWYQGVERINTLLSNGIDVWIKSNNFGTDVRDTKYHEIKRVMNIPDKKIILNLVSVKTIQNNKQIDKDVTVFVDDNPNALANSNAKYNIAIKQPWNTSSQAKEILKDKHVIYFDTLNKAIDYIIALSKLGE